MEKVRIAACLVLILLLSSCGKDTETISSGGGEVSDNEQNPEEDSGATLTNEKCRITGFNFARNTGEFRRSDRSIEAIIDYEVFDPELSPTIGNGLFFFGRVCPENVDTDQCLDSRNGQYIYTFGSKSIQEKIDKGQVSMDFFLISEQDISGISSGLIGTSEPDKGLYTRAVVAAGRGGFENRECMATKLVSFLIK